MVKRVFTFGHGQTNPKTGESLHKHYVVMEGKTVEHCRLAMFNHFGRQWSFEYADEEKAGVEQFNLIEVPREEWPLMGEGKYRLDDKGFIEYVGGH